MSMPWSEEELREMVRREFEHPSRPIDPTEN